MPLPNPNSTWPPKELEQVFSDLARWSAWWTGDPDQLSRVYGGNYDLNNGTASTIQQQGLIGFAKHTLHRWFWGEKTPAGQRNTKLHVPVASEIPEVSANLIFAQPPSITVKGDDTTQLRLDDLISERSGPQLHEGAETAAALGHVYLRVGWDLDIDPENPLLSVVDADAAVPRYSYGRLQDVVFVREWDENGTVLRHLELHELGIVWHAAYLGDYRSLGRQVALSDHPETADWAETGMVSDDSRAGSGIETGLSRLDVVGVPNARSKTWRHIPAARDLGRPDIAGVEQALDSLDDAYTSLMRDVRHGRSRIHVPAHMLEPGGPGKSATFDLDRELYVGLTSPPDGPLQLQETQFKIRYEEHLAVARGLIERIVSGAGYSLQTFGLDPATTTQTATESWARQIRTQHTRNAKLRHWKTGVLELSRLMLEMDRVHFGGNGNPDAEIQIQFADTVSESQIVRAQTALALLQAEAASTRTRVELVHNDWDGDQIDEEVQLIEGAQQQATADQLAAQQAQQANTADMHPQDAPPDGPGGGTGQQA